MKCIFCPSVDVVHTDTTGTPPEVLTYNCPQCQVSMFIVNNVMMAWQFCIMNYKGTRFWIEWSKSNNRTEIISVSVNGPDNRVKKIKIPGQAPLTPHNILQKLPTILTFS